MNIREMVLRYFDYTGIPDNEIAGLLEVSTNLIFQVKKGSRNVSMGLLSRIMDLEKWTWKDFVNRFSL